jgi:tetratricopeptide (TPR) repeat protein
VSETIPRKSTTDFELLKANLRSASRLNAEYRYEEADALVRDTIAQFPEVSDASAHYVQLAWARGDLLVTVERAEDGRNRFPDNPECYLKAADALRLLGSFDRSGALVADGLQRFPKHPGFIIQAALLAEIRGDWSGVEAWMARLRELFPDRAMSWVQSASSLLRGSRTEAADALLVEALARFPNEPELHALRATVAEDQRRWDEADRRWQSARANFPDDPSIALKHALVWGRPPRFGAVARDMPEVFERFEQLHAAFPDFARGYSAHIGQLHNDAKLDDAEALARLARARFPDDVHVAIEAARVAMAQENTNAAIGILTESASKIPNSPLIPAELVAILAETGRLEEAEAVCAAACARFRSHARLFIEFAELAMRREDFPEALLRWTDGSKRFPQEVSFQRGVARARLRLIGRGHDPGSEEPADEEFTETDISVRRLLLNFESLDGCRGWPEPNR